MQNDVLESIRQDAIIEAQKLGIGGGFVFYLKTMELKNPEIRQFYITNPVHDGKGFLRAAREQYMTLSCVLRVSYDNAAYTIFETNSPDPTKSRMKNIETCAYDKESYRAQTIYTYLEEGKTFCGPCEFGKPAKKSPVFENFFGFFEHYAKEHGVIDLFGCHFCGRCYTTKSEFRAHDCDAYQSMLATSLLDKNYKGDMNNGIVFCACADCGKHQDFKIAESQSEQSFFEFSRFYIQHSPKHLALMVVWCESEFLRNPKLVIKTSLRCDLKIECKECDIASFDTVANRNAHFASAHAETMTKKCPFHECNKEYIDEFRFKEHVLKFHLKNGLLAHFLKHDATVRRYEQFFNFGKLAGRNEIDRECFVVGGIDSNSKNEFMLEPPSKITPKDKSHLPFDEDMYFDANAMNINFKGVDRNLKISKTAFKRNGRGTRVKNMKILHFSDMSDLSIAKDLTDECTIEINLNYGKGGIEGIDLKYRLGYCVQCERILNGPDAIKCHPCSEKEVTILAIRGYRTHSTVRCPKCEGINCCSVDGLLYHLFETHNTIASYEEDATSTNDEVKPLTREANKNNRLCSIGNYTEISDDNVTENQEIESRVINEASESEIERCVEATTHTSEMECDYLEVQQNDVCLASFVNGDELMDTGEGETVEANIVSEDVSIDEAPSSNGEQFSNAENKNCVVQLDDDDDLLPDISSESLQCLAPVVDTQSTPQETSLTSRVVRNEEDDFKVDPAVMDSAVAEENDDILIVEDFECSKSKRSRRNCCTKCQNKFYTEKGLQMHMDKDHLSDFNDLYETDYGIPKEGTIFVCLHCVSAFDDLQKFQSHISKHAQTLYDCPYCSTVCTTDTYLREHIVKHQQQLLLFSCGKCFESFGEESHLLYHMALLHGIPVVFYCKKCFVATCAYDPAMREHVCNHLPANANITVDQILGCVPASLLAFQPNDEEAHKKKLEECPSSFVNVSTCSHRSLCRSGDYLINCQEEENGSTCNVMMNVLAFEGMYKARKGFDAEVTLNAIDHHKGKSIAEYYFDYVKTKAVQNETQQEQVPDQQGQQQVTPQPILVNHQMNNLQQQLDSQAAEKHQNQLLTSPLPQTLQQHQQIQIHQQNPNQQHLVFNQESQIVRQRFPQKRQRNPRQNPCAAYDLALNVLRIDPSLLCFFCCNENPEMLVQLQHSDVIILSANILKFYGQQYGHRDAKILHVYLTKRSVAVKKGGGKHRPVSMCRNHFFDRENTTATAVLALLPRNYLVSFESVESNPVIQRIHCYVDEQCETNNQQQMVRTVAIRPPLLKVGCSLCEFLNTPTKCDFFSMLRLDSNPSKIWLRQLTKQLKSKIPNLQADAAENILKKGNFLCIKHFTPSSFGLLVFQLVLLKDNDEQNFPLLEPWSGIFTANFIERSNLFYRTLQAGQASVHQVKDLLNDLRAESICKFEGCKRNKLLTSEDVVTHSIHEKEDHFLCFICKETIAVEENNLYWTVVKHLILIHGASDATVGCSIVCDLQCGLNFNCSFDYRIHIHERHRSIHRSCCGQRFLSAEEQIAHDEKHKSERTLECCTICDYVGQLTFYMGSRIVRHEWLHSVDLKWNCRTCLEQFENKTELTNHYKNVHNMIIDAGHFFKFSVLSVLPKHPEFPGKLVITKSENRQ